MPSTPKDDQTRSHAATAAEWLEQNIKLFRYTANQYVSYTTTSDQFKDFAPGIYRVKATATLSASEVVSTDYDQTKLWVTD